jgi:hypothetical protein
MNNSDKIKFIVNEKFKKFLLKKIGVKLDGSILL